MIISQSYVYKTNGTRPYIYSSLWLFFLIVNKRGEILLEIDEDGEAFDMEFDGKMFLSETIIGDMITEFTKDSEILTLNEADGESVLEIERNGEI